MIGISGRKAFAAFWAIVLVLAIVLGILRWSPWTRQGVSVPGLAAPSWHSGFDPCSEATPANIRRAREHFLLAARTLDDAMAELATLDGSGPVDASELDRFDTAAAGLSLAIRDLMPIEDYPRALYGFADRLRSGSVSPSPDYGDMALLESAFINTLFSLDPASRRASGDYIEALTNLWALVSVDERPPSTAPDLPAISVQAQVLREQYKPFAAALLKALAHHDFEQRLAEESRNLCNAGVS